MKPDTHPTSQVSRGRMPIQMGEINKVIDEAIELADLGSRGVPARAIAERIYDSEPDFAARMARDCVIERLAWLISRRRRARWNDSQAGAQMMLPDPIFQNLPRTVILRDGTRPALDSCTLQQVKDHIGVLRARYKQHPRITQMEAVFELMQRHAIAGKKVTWATAKQAETTARDKG